MYLFGLPPYLSRIENRNWKNIEILNRYYKQLYVIATSTSDEGFDQSCDPSSKICVFIESSRSIDEKFNILIIIAQRLSGQLII